MLRRLIDSPRLLLWLGLLVFVYSWLVSLCLQLWVIPHLFSQPGASEGLVVLDSIGFHRIARDKAAEIARLGWSAWELRPEWQMPAGLASVFYAAWGSSPSSMLPFNALVHAASACLVMAILRNFFSAAPALLGALVFALNPASLEWVAQIHRDGVFILGNLLFILGIMRFFRRFSETDGRWLQYLPAMASMPIIGTLLVWMARPYWVQVMLVTILLVMALLVFVMLSRRMAGCKGHMACLAAALISVFAFQLWLVRFHTPTEAIQLPAPTATEPAAGLAPDQVSEREPESASKDQFAWKRSSWLPRMIEERFYRIAVARRGAVGQGGNTLVDADWRFDSVGSIIGYIPRALQLGLFSPLPGLWGGEGSTPAMTMARKVMGAATLFFYGCMIGIPFGIKRMWRDLSLWVMLGASLIGILVYAITYPNIGTLIRYRYGFYMLLIGFGVASWCDLWLRWRLSAVKNGRRA